MTDTDLSIDDRIGSFAAAVRRHLDDLPADELDDIMSGLVADLTEQAADDGDVAHLGDPAAYAEELRTAAGLPPRSERRRRVTMGEALASWRTRTAERIRRNPAGAWVLDFLLSLRPFWWIVRGYCLYLIAQNMRSEVLEGWWPSSPLSLGVLLAFLVISIQWGRGRWLPANPLRHIRTVASIAALIALPYGFVMLTTPRVEFVVGGSSAPLGLTLDGVQINNIFAYDADGEPIPHVQLFTGKGTPINLYGNESSYMDVGAQDDGETVTVPFRDFRDQPIWNVFPLDEGTYDDQTGEAKESSLSTPAPPFQRAPSIEALAQGTEPTPTPTGPVVDPTPAP